jgi:hypothetical protein
MAGEPKRLVSPMLTAMRVEERKRISLEDRLFEGGL